MLTSNIASIKQRLCGSASTYVRQVSSQECGDCRSHILPLNTGSADRTGNSRFKTVLGSPAFADGGFGVADAAIQLRQIELAGDDTNTAGDGQRLAHYLARRHSHVVATCVSRKFRYSLLDWHPLP